MRQGTFALALSAALVTSGAALAGGGGNMNPAGSDKQPDPQQTGVSSYGTGEASRASAADSKEERMDKIESSKESKGSMDMSGSSEKKSQ